MSRFQAALHTPTNPLIELLMGIAIVATGIFLLRGLSLVTLFFLPVLHVPLGVFCLFLGILMVWAAWGDVVLPFGGRVLRLPVRQILLRLWCMRIAALCWMYVSTVAVLTRVEDMRCPIGIDTTIFTLHTLLVIVIAWQLAVQAAIEGGGE